MIAPLTLAGKLTQVATPEPKYVSIYGLPLWDRSSSRTPTFFSLLPISTYPRPGREKKEEEGGKGHEEGSEGKKEIRA